MKRFVICLDGTWNDASRAVQKIDGSKVFRPTNVLKLARATGLSDAREVEQITYYSSGVGTMNRAPDVSSRVVKFFDNMLGGGWGGGFTVNVEEAYTFLANNYQAGDEIFIFGFSRGAAQARSLVRLIEWFGGFPTKNDVYYTPRIFTRYLINRGERAATTLWDDLNQRRADQGRPSLDPIVPANIVFLGVWDTVLALGSRLFGGRKGTSAKLRFHAPSRAPRIVQHVRHAIAIDERRHDFQAEVYDRGDGHPSLEQRWFAGVHSNVGGGLQTDGLANSPLRWIVQEAAAAGLGLRDDFLGFFGEFPLDEAPGKTLGYHISDALLWPLRGFSGLRDLSAAANPSLDDAVIERLNADPAQHEGIEKPYRPKNLMRFLAGHGEYDDKLGERALADVRKLRDN